MKVRIATEPVAHALVVLATPSSPQQRPAAVMQSLRSLQNLPVRVVLDLALWHNEPAAIILELADELRAYWAELDSAGGQLLLVAEPESRLASLLVELPLATSLADASAQLHQEERLRETERLRRVRATSRRLKAAKEEEAPAGASGAPAAAADSAPPESQSFDFQPSPEAAPPDPQDDAISTGFFEAPAPGGGGPSVGDAFPAPPAAPPPPPAPKKKAVTPSRLLPPHARPRSDSGPTRARKAIPSRSAARPVAAAAAPPAEMADVDESFAPAPKVASVAADERLRRKTTVRYFHRMNPLRNFPLLVVLSEEAIRRVELARVKQAEGTGLDVARAQPVVTVVPRFPGCLVVPDRLDVDVTPSSVDAQFFVTPLAPGVVQHARVEFWHGGRCLDTIDTPCQVRTQFWARTMAFGGVLNPMLFGMLDGLGVNAQAEAAPGALLMQAAALFGNSYFVLGLVGAAAFAAAGYGFYRRNRPREANTINQFLQWHPGGPSAGARPADA